MRRERLTVRIALSLVAVTLLCAASGEAPVLPPGHPKIDSAAPAEGQSNSTSGELPPGHPKVDAPGSGPSEASPGAGELPPGHPQVRSGNAPRSADEILKQLDATPDLKQRDKSFEIAAAVGKLYYGRARYSDAADYLGQAAKKAEPTRSLYLEQRRKMRSSSAGRQEGACDSSGKSSLEAETAEARKMAQAGKSVAALSCLRAALEPELEVEELRANALFLTGDSAGALAGYERALAVSSDRAASLYGRASVLIDGHPDDVKSLRQAKDDLTRFLAVEPAGEKATYARKLLARTQEAISAGGMAKVSPPSAANQQPQPLTPEVMESIKNTERTPELQAGLAKLVEEGEEHLARARYQDALDAYKRVVPFQPDNGRAKAGMAWALVGLQRQPMADRVWSVAVSADPAAVEKLGDVLAGKGDKTGAKALWKKLAETAPAYAQSSGLSAKLR
jgi:hypothetical protein